MGGHRVVIVIPALNESATIFKVVKNTLPYGLPIVVDDGSTDATATLAGQAGALVISHEANLGYDQALNSGFSKASDLGAEVIITLDADGQHNPDLIKKFIDQIDAGFDCVVGNRNKKQRIGESIFALYTNYFYGIGDPLCGMKAYTISAYNALGYFDSYQSVGTQLLIFLAKRKCALGQVNFRTYDRVGLPRFGTGIKANYKIIRALILACFRI